MSSIYKANDVRGKYPEEINDDIVFQIAKAIGNYFKLKSKSSLPTGDLPRGENLKAVIVVGHDARLSSPALYRAVLAGLSDKRLAVSGKNKRKNLNANRSTLYAVGLMTTPMLYFLVNKLKADGGIMVTASHNPKEYNGLKVVKKGARPMGGKEIEKLLIL